jgi:hypothetical protein
MPLRKDSYEDGAYVAAQWAGGMTQKEIAAALGYTAPSTVCVAIAHFLHRFATADEPREEPYRGYLTMRSYGESRRAMVAEALANFRRFREDAC